MKWNELNDLGKDISENGLKHKIELFKGKVLDGRNRYIACKLYGVTPEFIRLPDNINPLSHIVSMNIRRRHLTKAQRCKIGLILLEREKELAKIRKEKTYLAGKDKNNLTLKKTSVSNIMLPTEENNKKGRALNIAAKKVDVDSRTLHKYAKITEAAKNNEEIKKKLREIDKSKNTIGKVYRTNILPEKKLNIRKECTHIRAAPCSNCYAQIIACSLDLKNGNLILRKECPEDCINFN